MDQHITLLQPQPDTPPTDERGVSALPTDLLDQVCKRVRLLAAFVGITSAIGPVLALVSWIVGTLAGDTLPKDFVAGIPFRLADAALAVVSAALWWVARSPKVSPSRLYTIGLAYEVTICFVIAFSSYWQEYVARGILPTLTWLPVVVIVFPLIMPGPPRRMLGSAIVAGAMAPLALLVLQLRGTLHPDFEAYFQAVLSSSLAVALAFMGARIVYGLGRQVAAARELGSYSLEEKLGAGGMGEVWRARHRLLSRPAAIKLIRPSFVTGDAVRRFEREAQVTARLRSPHTVQLFDFGVAADGAFYYAMELLEGLDVETLVRRSGPVPSERAIFLLRQVCHSLSEAESCGLVHRDIKPANIFLCRYGEDYDFVKVLDFGIVKATDETTEPGSALTRDDHVKGTPAFMAPEQAMGHCDLDGRADIYATGCVAYWLLTGELVFSGATPMALLMHHVQTPPNLPSTRTTAVIPPALDRLVMSCLAKNPADRPQSAKELSRRLSEVESANPWTDDRARAWWVTHQAVPT